MAVSTRRADAIIFYIISWALLAGGRQDSWLGKGCE
eukprot:CAMPEP_0174715710 /NCGR_PEP_ID=MMETSP1094-20130205/22038_1 /TAXON_ID=156173 /ORGANISM="Chrysochromulina brevifilum, Strain UTEX LB 985" /LENGTH=35 /DNA_ID= /DNA_START= /DNA_END= /DNA_ORIENTATION=